MQVERIKIFSTMWTMNTEPISVQNENRTPNKNTTRLEQVNNTEAPTPEKRTR
jgi:hypothetical protein